jgi:hypothetical protein
MLERKMCDKEGQNFDTTQLAPSSQQRTVHKSLKTTEFVANNNMVIIHHPPYSLDLAPCDLALFPKLKMKLKGRHFETVSAI